MSGFFAQSNREKERSSAATVWQSAPFVVLWLSEGISMVGDRLLMVALISLVYDRTGSAGVVGLLMVFKAMPALLLGSLAGVFVDRWNRKWIMVTANLIQGLLVFLLPIAWNITMICLIYLAMSAINQFFVPARSAVIPDLVPPETLITANSLFALSIVFAIAIGPAAGTWITENISLNAAFYLDSATFLIPAAAVAFLSIPYKQVDQAGKNLGQDLKAGYKFALSQPSVLIALSTITTVFFIVGTISVSGVVITRQVLYIESSKFGYLMSGLGAGMVVGAVISNVLKRWFSGVHTSLGGTTLMAAALILLPVFSNLVTACLVASFIGVGMILVQINGQFLLQTVAPDLRGRLMGISQTLTGSATFLASALVGLLLEKMAALIVLQTIGSLTILTAAFAAVYYGNISKRVEQSR